jgi:hypothetical protein
MARKLLGMAGLPVKRRRFTVRAEFWYLAPTGFAASALGDDGGKLG